MGHPIDPILLGQLRLLVVERAHNKIITGAGLVQLGKSNHAIRTSEFNYRISKNPYVIASIEAPLKQAD